jgi:hypothetical protein
MRTTYPLLALLLAVSPLAAEEAAGPVMTKGTAVHYDTSPPLLEMAQPVAPPTGLSKEVPIRMRPREPRAPVTIEPDGGVQLSSRPNPQAGATPAPTVSAPGLSEQDNVDTLGIGIVPPDTNGDIGLDEEGNKIYVQYINLVWGVFDDTGALTDGPFAGNSFWAGFGGFCQTENDGDPIVLYDDYAGRWFFSQFSIDEGVQCVAVSTTSDPLGPYHRYAFPVTPGGANDYPKLGVWSDGTIGSSGQSAYTFTLRDFGGAGGPFSVSAGVLDRDQILVGGAADFVKFSNPCTGTDCLEGQLPPHLEGPEPPANTCPTFWAAIDSAYDDTTETQDGYRNHTLCVDWADTGSSTYVEGSYVAAGSNFNRFLGNGFSDCIAPVPTPGEILDCLAAFTMYRAQYRWFETHASVVFNTTVNAGSARAGIRWAELRSTDGQTSWSNEQDGTYAPDDGIERWMGSIAQDSEGNMALGYSATSDSLMPSVRYTSRMAGDGAGTMPGGEVSCHEGTGVQTASSNRWGDYSSMSVDPVDDCTFWFTTEYYETTGSFNFNTRICSFRLCNLEPSVAITNPADGSTFDDLTAITFMGSGSDDEDGDISSNLDWTSSLDGSIGTGASFSLALSAGLHEIEATVTDSGGKSASDQITVSITTDDCPATLDVGPLTVSGSSTFSAVNTITVLGGVTVESAGSLLLKASQTTAFENGLIVEGALEVVDTDTPCD